MENNTLDLNTMFNETRSLEVAQKSLDSHNNFYEASVNKFTMKQDSDNTLRTCWKCGNSSHPRSKCSAKDVECFKCGRKGHFSKVCRSKVSNKQTPAAVFMTIA